MRRLGLLDVVIILAVVALLVFALGHDFGRYAGRTAPPAPTASQKGE